MPKQVLLTTVVSVMLSLFSVVVRAETLLGDIPNAGGETRSAIEVLKFAFDIPESKKGQILETLNKFFRLAPTLPFPEKIEVVINRDGSFVGAQSKFVEGELQLGPEALDLSPVNFQALLAHEFTHFLIAKTFRVLGSDEGAPNLISGSGELRFNSVMAHLAYAELLGDVVSVLIFRDPKILTNLIKEVREKAALYPASRLAISHLRDDRPLDLSVRDFTVDPQDPRWTKYNPYDATYSRFNQVRGYFWTNWLNKLPEEASAAFFAKLVRATEVIYRTQQLERIAAADGLYSSNLEFMRFLDKSLPQLESR